MLRPRLEREHRSHVWSSDSDKFLKAGSQWLEEQCGWDSLLGWLKPSGLYSPQPAPPANRMGASESYKRPYLTAGLLRSLLVVEPALEVRSG